MKQPLVNRLHQHLEEYLQDIYDRSGCENCTGEEQMRHQIPLNRAHNSVRHFALAVAASTDTATKRSLLNSNAVKKERNNTKFLLNNFFFHIERRDERTPLLSFAAAERRLGRVIFGDGESLEKNIFTSIFCTHTIKEIAGERAESEWASHTFWFLLSRLVRLVQHLETYREWIFCALFDSFLSSSHCATAMLVFTSHGVR